MLLRLPVCNLLNETSDKLQRRLHRSFRGADENSIQWAIGDELGGPRKIGARAHLSGYAQARAIDSKRANRNNQQNLEWSKGPHPRHSSKRFSWFPAKKYSTPIRHMIIDWVISKVKEIQLSFRWRGPGTAES